MNKKKIISGLISLAFIGSLVGSQLLTAQATTQEAKKMSTDVQLVKSDTTKEGKTITYRLQFDTGTVPMNKLVLRDQLESVLQAKSAIVYDKDGNDVTGKGTLSLNEKTGLITWSPGTANDFYNRRLYLEITAVVRENVDFSKYEDKDGIPRIPNVGQMIQDDKTTNTPPVTEELPKTVNPSIDKTVEGKKSLNIDYEKQFTYEIDVTIPTNRKVDKLEIVDDMPDVLEPVKAVVKEGKTDVTSKGTLTLDKVTSTMKWVPKSATEFKGHKLTIELKALIKNTYKVKDFANEKGVVVIPNSANLRINDGNTPTPPVTVTPPEANPQASKFIVKPAQ
ncbi:isopeptide-forming domain-containing fimbrial protein [Enterococcus cecorum]